MPPRTRRYSTRLADLQPDSDVDMDQEDEIDVENDDEEPELDDTDGEGQEEEEEDDDDDKDAMQSEEDEDEEPIPSPRKSQPRLRIRLRLGNGKRIGSSDDSTARPTPEVEATPSRVRVRRKVKSEDMESQDSMSPESEDEEGSASGSRPPGRPKPMTTRQAVLASMVDSRHVALGEGRPSKKKVLNETELALRREETARKRKNLTEKKLQDEKAETINRLLKKQSRPRNKRGTALDDRSPMPGIGRKTKAKVKEEEGEGADEGEEEEVVEVVQEEVKPVMYRWTSTRKVDGDSSSIVLSFSVPQTVALPSMREHGAPRPSALAVCAVEGCGQLRKYRLVKDWTIGACGMSHLKLLEG